MTEETKEKPDLQTRIMQVLSEVDKSLKIPFHTKQENTYLLGATTEKIENILINEGYSPEQIREGIDYLIKEKSLVIYSMSFNKFAIAAKPKANRKYSIGVCTI